MLQESEERREAESAALRKLVAKLRSTWAAVNGLPEKPRVRRHRYILAFALTDFKVRCTWLVALGDASYKLVARFALAEQLQGRTLPKLILSICTRKHLPWMTLKAFYVLVSRVRNLSALRLLQHDEAALMKVSRVRHDEYLHAWDNGYDVTGCQVEPSWPWPWPCCSCYYCYCCYYCYNYCQAFVFVCWPTEPQNPIT